MAGQTDLEKLVKGMNPVLNTGEYVFCTVTDLTKIERGVAICEFREKEGTTLVIERHSGSNLNLACFLKMLYIGHEISIMIQANSLQVAGWDSKG